MRDAGKETSQPPDLHRFPVHGPEEFEFGVAQHENAEHLLAWWKCKLLNDRRVSVGHEFEEPDVARLEGQGLCCQGHGRGGDHAIVLGGARVCR